MLTDSHAENEPIYVIGSKSGEWIFGRGGKQIYRVISSFIKIKIYLQGLREQYNEPSINRTNWEGGG